MSDTSFVNIAQTNSLKEVLGVRRHNDWKVWCGFDADNKATDAVNTAKSRFESNTFFNVHSVPKFKLKPGSAVYTIGSCFARNVEAQLRVEGFQVPTAEFAIPLEHYISKVHFPNTILNKYTAHSSADEILRAIGDRSYPDNGLLEVSPGLWFDPQTSHTKALGREAAVEQRSSLDKVMGNLIDCDTLVLTLGLTETWVDEQTGAIFNQLNTGVIGSVKDRVRFFNADAEAALGVLSHALERLHVRKPSMNVVVTVSPVPLAQTFTDMDVVAANTLSKAILRGVAHRLTRRFDFVDYYPSFEMVMNSPRHLTWIQDQIHVNGELVRQVIAEFTKRYVERP